MHDASLFNPILNPPFTDFADCFRHIERHRAGFGIGHQPSGPEHLSELPDRAHEIGGGDGLIKLHPPALDLLDKFIAPYIVGASRPRFLLFFPLREHQDTDRFTGPVGEHRGPAHHLIRPLGIDAEPKGQIHGFVKLGEGNLLHKLNSFLETVRSPLEFSLSCPALFSHAQLPYSGLPQTGRVVIGSRSPCCEPFPQESSSPLPGPPR